MTPEPLNDPHAEHDCTRGDIVTELERGNINQRACAKALQYAMFDGAHHKQWCIDQMLRVLAGDGYAAMIERFNREGGEDYEEWDTGIAP